MLPRAVIALRGTARPYEGFPGRAQRGRRTPCAGACRPACRQRTYPGREVPNPITVDIVRGDADLALMIYPLAGGPLQNTRKTGPSPSRGAPSNVHRP